MGCIEFVVAKQAGCCILMGKQRLGGALTQKTMIGVLLVDDHDLFRTGLASLLGSEPDIEVLGQASRGRLALQLTKQLQPDVVLMDLDMPELDAAEATRLMLEHHPEARVLALTVLPDESAMLEAVEAGVRGFVAKDTPVEMVAAAVRAAAQGGAWLSPRAAEVILGRIRLVGSGSSTDAHLLEQLSPREQDVLRLIARGLNNSEISDALQISTRTAKNHVSNILAKLRTPTRTQAAIYAVRGGFG